MGFACALAILLCFYTIKVNSDQKILLNTYENENDGMGNSKLRYETSDGVKREEIIQIVNENSENEQVSVSGYYYYVSPGGYRVRVDYVADENGFRPKIAIMKHKPNLKHRIPSSALASLQGGGLG